MLSFSNVELVGLYGSLIYDVEKRDKVIALVGEKYHADIDTLDACEVLDVDNWHDTELEAVEGYAVENGLHLDCEETLSADFDALIEDLGGDLLYKFQNGMDLLMLREEFNNYADSQCKDGELHPLQYSQYCYVGKFDSE